MWSGVIDGFVMVVLLGHYKIHALGNHSQHSQHYVLGLTNVTARHCTQWPRHGIRKEPLSSMQLQNNTVM